METMAKTLISASFLLKIASLRTRARLLTGLRKMVGLKPHQDISAEQWDVLTAQLAAVSNKINGQLRVYTDHYLSEQNDVATRQILINRLGELEMELTAAYTFYDTFLDMLTQRLSDDIGPLLRGCDRIAADALQRSFLAETTVPPLVYCDRGFGASTLREGVHLSKNIPNPIPFIAIPYSRMMEKYNLISINHEVGHQALIKLNMVGLWQQVFKEALKKAAAPPIIQDLYANWAKEIVPDFWAFCLSGMAQTCSIRDVLVLPTPMMFSISTLQPHPPSYLRFLVSVECCRQMWGQGDWDGWEIEWLTLYPTIDLDEATRQIIIDAQQYIPVAAKALLQTKFKKLGNKPLTSLFDMAVLNPKTLKKWANVLARNAATEGSLSAEFKALPIGAQLAVFRLMREKRTVKQGDIDRLMTNWLKNL